MKVLTGYVMGLEPYLNENEKVFSKEGTWSDEHLKKISVATKRKMGLRVVKTEENLRIQQRGYLMEWSTWESRKRCDFEGTENRGKTGK